MRTKISAQLHLKNSQHGFSVLELILASAIFMIFAIGSVSVVLQGIDSNRLGEEQSIATQFAAEGLEAARSIKNQGFANLVNSSASGLARVSNLWAFSGTQNQFGPSNKYRRSLSIADVQRDVSGNIVTSGGTLDPDTKKVSSVVTWNVSPTRPNSVNLITYLTNWRANYPTTNRGGMLVYGDGGTTNDAIRYKTLSSSQTWSTAQSAADVDAGTTNRAVRSIKVYASSSRNEKIILSRHYNGTTQYIYGQVFNGTSWGNVQLMASWNAATFLDVQNFDGTYMANGNFMVVFSDNTIIPKMRVWNGTTWSAQTSLTTLAAGNIPNFIVTKARPGTNEVMAALFTQASDANTEYYNGSAWSAVTVHSAVAPLATKKFIDFDWSPNNSLIGGLVYTNSATDRSLDIKIWTANGLGSGAWSAVASTANQGVAATRLGAMSIKGRPGANQFLACNNNTRPNIICYISSFTPAWTNPTNQILAAATHPGIQQTFGIGFEQLSGDPAVAVYSDNTTTPKLKKFTAATTTWDAAATSLSTIGSNVATAKVVPNPISNDVMMLYADLNLDVFSQGWNGASNSAYTPVVGTTNLETNLDSNSVGMAEAFVATATKTQAANLLSIYLDSTNLATTIYVGVYTNSAGHPGTLLSQASSSALVNGAWNTISIPSVNFVNGANYWITILGTGGGVPVFRDRAAGSCSSETSFQTSLTSLPATWTTGTVFTTCPLSAYVGGDGLSLVGHGINGSNTAEYWYDFTWDNL